MGGVFVKSAGVIVARGRWCSMWFGVRVAAGRGSDHKSASDNAKR